MPDVQEFRPELLSRREEFTAWILSLGLAAALFVANSTWLNMPSVVWAFETVLLFSAASISLGNWVDRHTVIRVDAQGIHFANGLRSVRLSWPEVMNVAVTQGRAGSRVQVLGDKSHFSFKMMGNVSVFGQTLRSGFVDGQMILDTILKASHLKLTEESQGVYYYARA